MDTVIAALKRDETQSDCCADLLRNVPDQFLLSELSIVYEVCGTLARKLGKEAADEAQKQLQRMTTQTVSLSAIRHFAFHPISRAEYDLYAIDALYFKTALNHSAILVSLDKRDFVDKLNSKPSAIETFHPSQFPY